MGRRPLESLGVLVRKNRGKQTLRETAKDIGISAATLLRVEGGRIPDVVTFGRICSWLEIDPAEFLGSARSASTEGPIQLSAHLRIDPMPKPETMQALANMLLLSASFQPSLDEHA